MENHLTTLGSTLEAIARLHASAPSSSRNVYRPFTCAVLNTYELDVLDYIRDADQVEANLFWYPPPSASGAGGKGEAETSDMAVTAGAVAKVPEPKEFVPPTPLRRNVVEAEAQGLIRFDARTLLKAAQKLLNNYHDAPRARKHVKALLKRHHELQKQTAQFEASVERTERLIERLSNPESARATAAAILGREGHLEVAQGEEAKQLQESIRKEKMEILALEQTTEDLLEKRQKLLSRKKRSQPPPSSHTPKRSQPLPRNDATSASPRSDISTLKPATPSLLKSTAAQKKQSTSSVDKVKQTALSKASLPLKEPVNEQRDEEDEDVTVRLPPKVPEERTPEKGKTTADTKRSIPGLTEPESSDELERICENVWTLFGDQLRFVAPEREGADYGDTLRLLQDLSVGGVTGTSQSGLGDESMASSSSGSQATAATTGSTASSSLVNAGPPTITVAVAAHALFILLTTPSPHVMEFDQLKTEAEQWWDAHGSKAPAHAASHDDGSANLGSKAIYSLIAKKLLRLQFRGAKRVISFPAHIH